MPQPATSRPQDRSIALFGSSKEMDRAAMLSTTLASFRASLRLEAQGARDTRVLELDGVTAAIVPGTPDRSVMNSVTYDHAGALEASLEELAAAYEDSGVRAWTVWVPDGDVRAVRLLEATGHKLDASPRAMWMELDRLGEPSGPEPDWSGEWDLTAAGLVNDRAYGDPDGLWERALGELPEGSAHLYLARLDGEPASFVLVHDHEEDCVFWFAATVPAARGRGLASGLLHRALRDARERSLRTTTTEATAMGRPVYERIGYLDLGPLHMYERRLRAE
jgi:GNAT superfamily N-acetyltransferase